MLNAVSGNKARLLVDQFNVSKYITRVSPSGAQDCYDSTTLVDDHKNYALGLKSGTMMSEGLHHDTDVTGTLDAIFASLPQGGVIVTGFPNGFTVGKSALLLSANVGSHISDSIVGDLVKTSIELTHRDGALEPGVSLHDLAAEVGTANGTAVDNGVATTNGGIAHLHVTAIAGAAPSVTFKIQHSTNGSTWADLGSAFTVVTAATTQRLTIAAGTTVNQFLRCVVTFGGTTTSVTFNISFARR